MTAFSEALWYEQRPLGVHVMTLSPGPTSTEPETESSAGAAARRHQDAPAAMVQSPAAVVRTALRALDRRTGPTVVPGRTNSLFVLATRLLPRRTLLAMLSR